MSPTGPGPERKHRLLFELGRGGMGAVFLAVAEGPSGFSKLKVVKQLNPRLAAEPQFLSMFLDEAKLSALLNHPNIVQTNEVGFDGQDYFIEMEFLEGQPYDAVIRRAAKADGIPLEASLWILAQVLNGLHYAHEMRSRDGKPLHLVHRDVSPHNIFITYEGAVKVLDFGIAKAVGQEAQTRTGVVKGKATYMAPEQAARRPLDRRADIFSVGIMLWEAIARKRLWEGLDEFDIFTRLAAGNIPPLASVVSAPAPLEAICARALAVDPDVRFPTAASFRDALEEYLGAAGLQAGARAVGKLVAELFRDRRAAIEQEIQSQLHHPVAQPQKIPFLTLTSVSRPTVTKETVSAPVAGAGEPTAPLPRKASAEQRGDAPEGTRTSAGISSENPPPGGAARRRWPTVLAAGVLACAAAATYLFVAPSRVAVKPPAAGVAVAGCSTNAECIDAHGGAPFLCRKSDHKCTAIDSEDCRANASPSALRNDETLWVGAMFKYRTGSRDMAWEVNAIELAQSDFDTVMGGIPRPDNPRGARPIATVLCDDGPDPERAARHLVEDLDVPAVIGFSSGRSVIDLYSSVFLPKRTLLLDTRDTTPLLSSLPIPADGQRLFWRLNASEASYIELSARVLSDVVEPALLADGADHPKSVEKSNLRLAIIRAASPMTTLLDDRFMEKLVWNGLSSVANGPRIRSFAIPLEGTNEKAEYSLDTLAQALLAFRPHAVFIEHALPELFPVLHSLEVEWPRDLGYRPWYVALSELDMDEVRAFVGADKGLRHRILGSQFRSETLANARFLRHYNDVYPDKLTPAVATTTSYDALYLIAYASAALGDAPLSGAGLASAMSRLQPPGVEIEVGPGTILDVIGALRRGDRVDLAGSSGSLDFDPRTGDARVDLVVSCLGVNEDGRAGPSIESGLQFDTATARLSGQLRCP